MARYSEYKDSGIQWLGEIPSHWDSMRLRFLCEFRNGYTPSKANQSFWEGGSIPWYRMEDIREFGRKLTSAKQYITEGAVKSGGLFEAGSFILATTATIGEHAMLIVDSLANQRFTNLKIRESLGHRVLHEYFFYYLFVIDDYCKLTTNKSTFPAVNMALLKNFPAVLPSIIEQQAIVDYLDKVTGQIDRAIEQQKQMIALLNERKQIVINQAVTKGLDTNAPMQDSGIQWLGEIPSHWDSMRLRFLCEFRNGYTPSKANQSFWEGGSIPWYRMEDIREFGRKLTSAKQYITEGAVKSGGLFEAGSFILATTATIGEHAMLIVDSLANQQFTNLKIRESLGHRVLHEYFFYYLFVIDDYCKLTTNKSTFPAVNMALLKNFPAVLPSIIEQQAIVDYLDKATAQIDRAIEQCQQMIALLSERKQIIINDVVSGKEKVL